MATTVDFPALLRLIEERSTAFRAAVASAPSLDVRVPTCPDWALFDLVQHLGTSHRRWAGIVAAGPATEAPTDDPAVAAAAGDRDALLSWSATSTERLLQALRESGPDRGCWTWWAESQSPQTCGAVARHQLQHVAVHTYDAHIAAGTPQPLPDEMALDGVDEFLSTCCAGTDPWPHEPCAVDYHATEGPSWRLSLSAAGARVTRLPDPVSLSAAPAAEAPARADAALRGTANELVLALYGRIPVASLQVDGDGRLFDQLLAWDPSA